MPAAAAGAAAEIASGTARRSTPPGAESAGVGEVLDQELRPRQEHRPDGMANEPDEE
jgi:hypothetical protein